MQSLRKLSINHAIPSNESALEYSGLQDPTTCANKPKHPQARQPIRKSQIRIKHLRYDNAPVPPIESKNYLPTLNNYALEDRHCEDIPDGVIRAAETAEIDWRQRLLEAREKRPVTLVLDDVSWDVYASRKENFTSEFTALPLQVLSRPSSPLRRSFTPPARIPPPFPPPDIPLFNPPIQSSSLPESSHRDDYPSPGFIRYSRSLNDKNSRRRAASQPRGAHANVSFAVPAERPRPCNPPLVSKDEYLRNPQKLLSDMNIEELREQLNLPPGRLCANTITRIRNRLAQLEGPSPEELDRLEQIRRRQKMRKLPDERDWLENQKAEGSDEEEPSEACDDEYNCISPAIVQSSPPRTRKFSNSIPQIPRLIGKLGHKSKATIPTCHNIRPNRWENSDSPAKSAFARSLSALSRPQQTRSKSAPVHKDDLTPSLNSDSLSFKLGRFKAPSISRSPSSPTVPTSYSSSSLSSYGSSSTRAGSSSTSLTTTISGGISSSSSSVSSHSWVIIPKNGGASERGKPDSGLVRSNSIHGPSPLRLRMDSKSTSVGSMGSSTNDDAPPTPPPKSLGCKAGEFGQNTEDHRVKSSD